MKRARTRFIGIVLWGTHSEPKIDGRELHMINELQYLRERQIILTITKSELVSICNDNLSIR
jgi:hypothetical protein